MSFIKKMTGMVVINNIEDTEAQILAQPPKNSKKKRKQNKDTRPMSTLGSNLPQDNFADLTEEARTEEKKEPEYKKKPTILDHMLYHDKLRIIYVVLLCFAVGLLIPYILSLHFADQPPPEDRGYCGLNITYRMECLPGIPYMNQEMCYTANCCFDSQMGDVYAPICFHTIPPDYSYFITNSSQAGVIVTPVERSSRKAPLFYSLEQDSLTLQLASHKQRTPLLDEAWPLQVLFQRQGENVVRIKIWDPEHPQDIDDDDFVEEQPSDWSLNVQISDVGEGFNISVSRAETGEEIFNTVFGPLIYGKNYMEVTARIPTMQLYGLGQRGNYDLLPDFDQRGKWALYNFDSAEGAGITYNSHPFYMNFERSGNMHGVYLRNTAPMEIGLYPVPSVVFRALGGSFDFRIFAGPTPREVTAQYTKMIGMPAMPPFWALGYHLCRTSSSDTEFEYVFDEMANNSLPYESDCVDARLTYPGSFTKLSEKDNDRVMELRDSGRKFWLTQYPFLTPGSEAYQGAMELDLLLKVGYTSENNTGVNYYGKVAEEAVGYPDFLSNDTGTWMTNVPSISDLYSIADGVILFRNSPLNEVELTYGLPVEHFCNETSPEYCCQLYLLKFRPANILDLNNDTLCSSLHHPSLEGEASLHLRSHNAYGRYHHQRTYEFKKSLDTSVRPLVTSQSTFPGSGAFGGHFGGNYKLNAVDLKKGLVNILQMGLYGVPLTGVPVCGSTNSSDDFLPTEWCLRGHQMGAFLPFMMNHYELDQAPRNPPNFQSGFMENLKLHIRLRYMLLPYMYKLFHEASTSGTPVIRPLFYEFPDDEGSRNVSAQFMLGNGLMISPVFISVDGSETTIVDIHFPPGCWYDYYKGTVFSNTMLGEDMSVPTLQSDINVHLLGGTIIPLQGNLHEDFDTTTESRMKPMILMVALPCELHDVTTTTSSTSSSTEVPERVLQAFHGTAYGELYMDDGVTPLEQNPPFHSLTFEANMTSLTITRLSAADPTLCPGDTSPIGFTTVIQTVQIYGVPTISQLSVSGTPYGNFTQDEESNAITVKHLNIDWCIEATSAITWELV